MERIIENGLNSIRVGLEDYEQALEANDDARLTSAVGNVYAGILILAKGKLYEMSPADTRGILIRVVRLKLVNGRVEVVPVGQKTIGYEEIKQRFEDSALPLDWAKIKRVCAADRTHRVTAKSPSAMDITPYRGPKEGPA